MDRGTDLVFSHVIGRGLQGKRQFGYCRCCCGVFDLRQDNDLIVFFRDVMPIEMGMKLFQEYFEDVIVKK